MTEEKFFVYEHWRPDLDVCFYVGKGKRKRVRSFRRKENQHHDRIANKLAKAGLCVEIRLVAGGLSELDAFMLEMERIAFWRANGIAIVNQTDGGEGASGCIRSPEFRAKVSAGTKGKVGGWAKGLTLSAEHKAKIAAAGIGRVVSTETRTKISNAQKGKLRPELFGRKFSPETIERMRSRVFTKQHRERISLAKKGKSKSAEHRAKLSLSLRAFAAKKRETIS